jgi:AraC-like DNA-binding protein
LVSRADFDFHSRVVPLLLAFAKARGLDVPGLVARFELPHDLNLSQPGKQELTTRLSTVRELAAAIAEGVDEPGFGHLLAESVPKGAYGVAEFAIRAGPTLRHTFQNLARFSGLIGPSQTFTYVETATEAQQHNAPTNLPTGLGRHLNEYTNALMARTLTTLCADAHISHVWFTTPAPASLSHLETYYPGARLSFDAPTNGFAIDARWLEQEVKGGDAALYSFLEEHAVEALASRPKTDDLVDRLRHLVREALKQGEPNVERLSTRLQMSGRTLQRRLADLGTSFQDVLDEVRFDLSRAYLKDDRLDFSQVAYLLGYSELRAFDRAFKRWAGVSPRDFRTRGPAAAQ